MRILVVEDERTLAGFIEKSLRAEGHAVTVCHDGRGGEAAALTGDYALVLLDLTLPGKDGLDVLAAIRSRLPVRHPDQVLSREQILNAVWGFDFDPGTKVLEVYIGYLRRKLAGGDPIETVRNVGYRLLVPRD
jgi:DNA-binding response OmpR family regulator